MFGDDRTSYCETKKGRDATWDICKGQRNRDLDSSLEDWCEVFGCENGGKSWVHLTRKYLQIKFPMTRHHNQCFVKLSQLTDNKQAPTHDHNTHSTYNANSTLPLYDALILRPRAWVGCYFDSGSRS